MREKIFFCIYGCFSEVEHHIFRHNRLFRHRLIFKLIHFQIHWEALFLLMLALILSELLEKPIRNKDSVKEEFMGEASMF